MEEKRYLKEKGFQVPAKKINPTDAAYLSEEELKEYLVSIEVLKPWEAVEVNKDIVGVPAFVISKVNMSAVPKGEDYKSREGMFFNIIQYKYSCDIKNGKIGKNSLANFTTYVKDMYSYSYPFFVLEKLKKIDKEYAKLYAQGFKAEITKLYDKKITGDRREMEKYQAEVKGATAEKKVFLSKIK
jgi:hypothetical protein